MKRLSMLRQICLPALMILTSHVFCQQRTNVDVTRVTKVAFLNPGLSYEDKVGRLQTIYVTAFLATNASYSYSSSLGTYSSIYWDPAVMAQYRYYYNAAAREAKGKRTEKNSLNYIGPLVEVTFTKAAMTDESYEEDSRRAVSKIGFVWGIQRNYFGRFSLDLNLGLGYFFTKGTELDYNYQLSRISQSAFTGLGNLTLGIWLNKR
jgi:hypothetical protein